MNRMKLILLTVLFLCVSRLVIAQDFIIKITQMNLPSTNKFEYIVENSFITIDCVGDDCNFTKKKIKINESQTKEIKKLIDSVNFTDLDSVYVSPMIDGVVSEFSTVEKKIILENYYHEGMNLILEYINSILPQKLQFITLENAAGKDD